MVNKVKACSVKEAPRSGPAAGWCQPCTREKVSAVVLRHIARPSFPLSISDRHPIRPFPGPQPDYRRAGAEPSARAGMEPPTSRCSGRIWSGSPTSPAQASASSTGR